MTQGPANEPMPSEPDSPLLVCMLPVRDAEKDLPGYLENVSRFCDAIVALDDGSTDATYDILASHPLVKVLLRNPPREGFREWNDAANRQRLLDATEELNPQWLIALDADERIDERDASDLREFLQTDALPGFVYGFRHVPMTDDGLWFRPRFLWYYRVFAAMPGQRLPSQKLHFVPVPTNIPRERWIKTTLRIQHLGELSAERRLARFGKYLEADPTRIYEMDYSRILAEDPDSTLRRWRPRPEGMPIFLSSAGIAVDDELDSDATGEPVVSVVVMVLDEGETGERAIWSAVSQDLEEPYEVIAVVAGDREAARHIRDSFPTVTVVEVAADTQPGTARNVGLDVARGKVVVPMDARTELLPGHLAARLKAHRQGYAMVTGTVYCGSRSPAAWASYLMTYADNLPGLEAGELSNVEARCSYGRLPLFEVGDFTDWGRVDVEHLANRALASRTYYMLREPMAGQIHRPVSATVARMIWEQFDRGRERGRLLLDQHGQSGGMLSWPFVRDQLLAAVPIRLRQIEVNAILAGGECLTAYRRYRSLLVLSAVSRALGMVFEVLRPESGKLEILVGRPVVTALIALGDDANRTLYLVQVDYRRGEMVVRSITQDPAIAVGQRELADRVEADLSQTVQARRETVAGVALAAGQLDSIEIDGRLSIYGWDNGESTGAVRLLHAASSLLMVAREMQRGRIRSTLSAWQTARLLGRIGARINR